MKDEPRRVPWSYWVPWLVVPVLFWLAIVGLWDSLLPFDSHFKLLFFKLFG